MILAYSRAEPHDSAFPAGAFIAAKVAVWSGIRGLFTSLHGMYASTKSTPRNIENVLHCALKWVEGSRLTI